MANLRPYAKSYYGPSVMAYPSSLEVFDVGLGIWHWNASCWLSYRQLDTVETNQIIFHIQKHLGCDWTTAREYCMLQLGTDTNPGHAPTFSTFMVFPRAEKSNAYHGGFGKCTEELMRKWTDEVMIPSVDGVFRGDRSRIAGATSHELIKLNSQAARVEGLRNVPDTPITVQVRCEELKALCDNIVRIAAEKRLTEFQDMFLVVVAGEAERGLQISGKQHGELLGSIHHIVVRSCQYEVCTPYRQRQYTSRPRVTTESSRDSANPKDVFRVENLGLG